MSKLAVVFTGQGSQYPHMGVTDLTSDKAFEPLLNVSYDILGYDILEVLKDEQGQLNQTIYAQPMILLLSIYLFDTIEALDIKIDGFLGFSLGEITALYASQTLSLKDTLTLIKHRAKWMHDASSFSQGAMAAVIGLDPQKIIDCCIQVSDDLSFVMPVNYNSLEQTVISGSQEKVEQVTPLLKEQGAKRILPLSVSGAFHTPYMEYARKKLSHFLEDITPNESRAPIYLNTTAKPHQLDTLKTHIANHVVSPVFFYQSIIEMKKDGFTHFLEIGPKPVLSALIKKIDGALQTMRLTSLAELEEVKGWLTTHGFKK